MSVPSYKRNVSKTEYIQKLAELNDFLRQLVFHAPKKYKNSYGDELIKAGLQAYLNASDANGIVIRKGEPEENYDERIKLLQSVKKYTAHVEYISQLFLACREQVDGEKKVKITQWQVRIGTFRAQIDALVTANIKYVKNKKKEDLKK